MKTITIITIILFSFTSSGWAALAPTKEASAIAHLTEVNKEWIANGHLAKIQSITFLNDIERIQYHLLEVGAILTSKNSAHLTPSQQQKRSEMLRVLHQYAMEMQFPQNTYHTHRQPYFIDIYGTHCAVGYLVMKSGNGDISKRISQTQNYAYVREIDSPELIEWSKEYGFTLDELAWIQPAYEYSSPYYAVGSGTNGRVHSIEHSSILDKTFIAGNFTMLGDIPCDNIAVFDGNQLSCFGGGINGVVNGLSVRTYGYPVITYVYVVGKFEHEGITYPIAKWENDEWEYISIPNMPDAEGTAVYTSNSSLVVGLQEGNQYVLKEWEYFSNDWSSNEVTLNGPIYTIAHDKFGGKFDTIFHSYSYTNENAEIVSVNDTVQTKNIAIKQHQGGFATYYNYIGITEHIPDTVFSIATIGLNTYVGGGADVQNNNHTVLSRIYNNVAQPLINVSSINANNTIYDMEFDYANNHLLIAGNLGFVNDYGIGYIGGKHLFTYNHTSGFVHGRGSFNQPVYSISYQSNVLMVGGDFTSAPNSEPLFHLAKEEGHLGIDEIAEQTNYSLFPNPAVGSIQISGIDQQSVVEISDAQGKVVIPGKTYNNSVDVTTLQEGIYFAKIRQQDKVVTVIRFVKL